MVVVIVAAGDGGIHMIWRPSSRILIERLDHFRAAHRRRIALDEGLAEQVETLAMYTTNFETSSNQSSRR